MNPPMSGPSLRAGQTCDVCKRIEPTTHWRANFVAPGSQVNGAMVCAACLAADQAKGVKS